jgi:hypothetical protein
MFVILDSRGRRMVMPRETPQDAIEQIAQAIAGRKASAEEKRRAWQHLRDERGYRIEQVSTTR